MACWGGWLGWEATRVVPVAAVQPVGGAAYHFLLPATALPAALEPRSDLEGEPARSRLTILEEGRPLGPAHAFHADIVARGAGRYSHWGPGVYFSASDSSDPRTNGRRYLVVYPLFLPQWVAWIGGLAATSLAAVVLLALRSRLTSLPGPAGAAIRKLAEVVGMATIGLVTVAVFGAVGEVVLRAGRPFLNPEWPSTFDPRVGPHLIPGARVRWTNQLDFWNEATVNSLGFLDREPSSEIGGPGACNVTFLGDSFVEAAQVPNEQKFHVLFEERARRQMPERRIVTQAFGYSGTGQLNQLPFYQVFARPARPRVVVLVFVSNDFANNSNVLEAVRNGWHPLRTPRLFARINHDDGSIQLQPIADDWAAHQLALPAAVEAGGALSSVHGTLLKSSYFYAWLWANLKLRFPGIASCIDPGTDLSRVYAARIREIDKLPDYDWGMRGWRYPRDLDLDAMFGATGEVPAAFTEAWDYTAFALDLLSAEAAKDEATVVALLSTSLSTPLPTEARELGGRSWGRRTALERLVRMLDASGIPYVDQQAYLDSIGVDSDAAHFRHDGHWSPEGHRYAAEALLKLFEQNPRLCAP